MPLCSYVPMETDVSKQCICVCPIGILLPGTEVLDSPVRMEFSTGSLSAAFIWLTMEFSSDRRVQQV